jgi:hypothetical protein
MLLINLIIDLTDFFYIMETNNKVLDYLKSFCIYKFYRRVVYGDKFVDTESEKYEKVK